MNSTGDSRFMNYSHMKSAYEILGRSSIHPFPARMAPGLALDVIKGNRAPLRILDPMSGSGTVVAVAHSRGHHAIGFDLDPLAVLISRVWTNPFNVRGFQDAGICILQSARCVYNSLQTRDAYPKDSDSETRQFIRFWFDRCARRQLASLAKAINKIDDISIRDALWCAFSRLIITKRAGASLAMDVSHSRPHRKYTQAPVKPFDKFQSAVNLVAKNCIDSCEEVCGPAAQVYNGDARHLKLPDKSVDVVITSPPYLNAIDYLRSSKLSLVWMGFSIGEIRRLRSISIGTDRGMRASEDEQIQSILADLELQPKLQRRQEAMLVKYIHDIRRVVTETSRVLVKNGRAVFVIGENTVRGTLIRNARIVERVANNVGLTSTEIYSRELPENLRYLPPPSKQPKSAPLGNRMRREVVLKFRKNT